MDTCVHTYDMTHKSTQLSFTTKVLLIATPISYWLVAYECDLR